jgi:hypothetical protein
MTVEETCGTTDAADAREVTSSPLESAGRQDMRVKVLRNSSIRSEIEC